MGSGDRLDGGTQFSSGKNIGKVIEPFRKGGVHRTRIPELTAVNDIVSIPDRRRSNSIEVEGLPTVFAVHGSSSSTGDDAIREHPELHASLWN